jgi:N-acetylglucosamine-6-phosphate deacetylase
MPPQLFIRNCRLYNAPEGRPAHILIEGPMIRSLEGAPHGSVPSLDAGGRIVAPGFIDLHIQGAGGADVLDATPEALRTMSAALARLGTTGFLGTSVSRPQDNNAHLRLMQQWTNRDLGGATLLGIHLEGPFINERRKGGLASEVIYPPSRAALEQLYDAAGDSLRMMTIAPELPGNLDIIRQLVARRTVAAFAHSEATYDETRRGLDAGISHVTHLFNAMPSLHHRNPGPVAAIFEHPSVSAQIISDGNHLHPAIVGLIWRNLGPLRCICITDGVQGMGLLDGRYTYNGKEYISKEGVARYPEGTLIGTTMSLGTIALRFMDYTGCSVKDAIESITLAPAKVLGLDSRKGSLEAGKDADMVILEPDFSVFCTIVGGKIVYENGGMTPMPPPLRK